MISGSKVQVHTQRKHHKRAIRPGNKIGIVLAQQGVLQDFSSMTDLFEFLCMEEL